MLDIDLNEFFTKAGVFNLDGRRWSRARDPPIDEY